MPEIDISHNHFAYSVTEISGTLKRFVEDNFGQIRVRGEISGWKLASSGHAYLKLKDANAVLDAVSWKGTVNKLSFKPEDGMEVICTGKLTTYPGRSTYQLVVDTMEPAGIGALMAMLEKRKKELAAEGLFSAERKRKLPYMPTVIGVVTSPTGAVIRDILHRLQERFPCHVLVWPVLVQGPDAAQQIANAINGFNNLPAHIEEPNVLIVARGGGSLEDLWAFNEEVVVRAAAASHIPLISAVGHETDTTLIDYVSDRRAPTPTAAAEIAVPVKADWVATLMDDEQRLKAALLRYMRVQHELITSLARGLAHPARMLDTVTQRVDDWAERLSAALPVLIERRTQQLTVAGVKLQPQQLLKTIERYNDDLIRSGERLIRLMQRDIEEQAKRVVSIVSLLESINPTRILERGFVLVQDTQGKLVKNAAQISAHQIYSLTFHDGKRRVKSEEE